MPLQTFILFDVVLGYPYTFPAFLPNTVRVLESFNGVLDKDRRHGILSVVTTLQVTLLCWSVSTTRSTTWQRGPTPGPAPPHSRPDVIPADFFLFPRVKIVLRGIYFGFIGFIPRGPFQEAKPRSPLTPSRTHTARGSLARKTV